MNRYLTTVALALRVAKLDNPVADEMVRLELKGFRGAVSVRQNQAHPLGWADVKEFPETAQESMRDTRAIAALSVAYDTRVRRSELHLRSRARAAHRSRRAT